MCGLYAYNQCKENSTGATDFKVGRPLTSNSNVIPLIFLCVTINFIDACINRLEKNIVWIVLAHQDKMKEKFRKNPKEVKKLTPEDTNKKHQTLLTEICGKWFMNKINNPKPPIKRPRIYQRKKRTGYNPKIIESGM